jgi:GTP-binding protein EngB required for normal cell division
MLKNSNIFLKTRLKITILGEFSCGKSTLINALIGKDLLPHGKNETTMDTEEIPFGDHILIDTPGINSTLPGHTELALWAANDSDFCVFVLSKPQITDAERNFIDKVKTKIIFVRNFLDEYFEDKNGENSEIDSANSNGEDIESGKNSKNNSANSSGENSEIAHKIANNLQNSNGKDIEFQNKNANNLQNINGEECEITNKNNIITISALKALSARDLTIERLYFSDTEHIADREKLLAESNFEAFESLLQWEIETIAILKDIEKLSDKIQNNNKKIEGIKSDYLGKNPLAKHLCKDEVKKKIRKLRLINKRLIELKTELEFRYIKFENEKVTV